MNNTITRNKILQTPTKDSNPNQPRKIITVKGSYYQKANQGDTPVGIILPNFKDQQGCFDQAERDTKEIDIQNPVRRQEFYNLALATYLLGVSCTEPSDYRKAHFALGGDQIKSTLNKEGIKHLYREVEVYAQSIDPLREPITDKGIDILSVMVKNLPPDSVKAKKARNALAYIAEMLME